MATQLMESARTFLRVFTVDGVASSGINMPSKTEGLQTFATIDGLIDGLYETIVVDEMLKYQSKAEMDASVQPDGTWAIILNAADASEDLDIYRFAGPASAWIYKSTLSIGGLPAQLAAEVAARIAGDNALDARVDALENAAVGEGNFIPATDAEMIAGVDNTKGATPHGTGVAIEGYFFDTYTGGTPYTTKDRFRREIPLEDTSLVFNSDVTNNGPALESYIEEAAFARKWITHRDGTKTLWVGEVKADIEGPVNWRFTPGFVIKGIGNAAYPGSILTLTNLNHLAGGTRYNVSIEHLSVDNSLRNYVLAGAGGTGLSLKGFDHVYTLRYTCRSTNDYADDKGDSGLSQNDCHSSTHIDFIAIGQPDLGIYITGDPADASNSTRVGHTLINPYFYRCAAAASFKKLAPFAAVYGGVVYECSMGIQAGGAAAGILQGPQLIVQGLRGKRLVSRLLYVGPEVYANVSGCYLQDWGYRPQDNVLTGSTLAAFHINGAKRGSWIGNRVEMVEWDGKNVSGNCRAFLITNELITPQNVSYEASDNLLEGNVMANCGIGIREENASDNNHGNNIFHSVTTPYQKGTNNVANGSFFGVRTNAVLATATITVSGGGLNNETLTVTPLVGSPRVYTLKTTLSTAPTIPNEIKTGASAAALAINVAAALNAGATAGTNYSIGTVANEYVTANIETATPTVIQITARASGVAGNSTVLSDTSASLTPTTMTGGVTGLSRINYFDPAELITTDAGAAYLLSSSALRRQRLTVPITATRTVTLPTAATLAVGKVHRFERTTASTGAFNWAIGTVVNLAVGKWCDIVWNGASWDLSAAGNLSTP